MDRKNLKQQLYKAGDGWTELVALSSSALLVPLAAWLKGLSHGGLVLLVKNKGALVMCSSVAADRLRAFLSLL